LKSTQCSENQRNGDLHKVLFCRGSSKGIV
jgi:hypothetical protein